jgi:hypothetical protein
MKKLVVIIILCIQLAESLLSQELNANVRVSAPNLGVSDKSIVKQMEQNVKDFLNNTKWTQDAFEPNERIKCTFQITISADRGNNDLLIDLSLQASRPVFNSSYETQMMNINDKQIPIHFDPYKNLENSKETYYENLSSVLTFYAYLILAIDYESFSLEGGEPFIQVLNNMLNGLPSQVKTTDASWSATKDNTYNRYFILENLMNPRMKAFRRAFYEYHRLGLDLISKDPADSRNTLSNAIGDIGRTNQSYPQTYLIRLFAFSKSQEIIEIFKQGTLQERQKVHQAMIQMDPANTSAYSVLLKT